MDADEAEAVADIQRSLSAALTVLTDGASGPLPESEEVAAVKAEETLAAAVKAAEAAAAALVAAFVATAAAVAAQGPVDSPWAVEAQTLCDQAAARMAEATAARDLAAQARAAEVRLIVQRRADEVSNG